MLLFMHTKDSDFQVGISHGSQQVSKMVPSSPFPSYQKAGYLKERQYHLENVESRDLNIFAGVLHVQKNKVRELLQE